MRSQWTATFFPFTCISPQTTGALSGILDRLILFQPAGMAAVGQPPSFSQRIDEDFLDIRHFDAEPVDEGQLMAEFQTWKAWGNMQQHGDLTFIKHMRDGLAPSGPIVPEMVSEIKGSTSTRKPLDNTNFACQLFLLLAHDFDQQSLELEAQLAHVNKRRESLQAFLQKDLPGEAQSRPQTNPFQDTPEDRGGVLTENRINAWSRLFRHETIEAPVLVTDSPAVYRFFLESTEDIVEIAQVTTPSGGAQENGSERSGLQDRLRDLFSPLPTTPWTEEVEKKTIERAGNIAEVGLQDTEDSISTKWFLVPGRGGQTWFQGNRDVASETEKQPQTRNTLVGFVSGPGFKY